MKSETISELAKALTNFQGKITAVKKDAINPFYKSKYATLDTIWEAIRKPLSENGLSIAQTMDLRCYDNGSPISVIETTLYHTSGEWISGVQLVNPTKDDPQALGSAISYARRYSLSAILGIVADEDDDAETATVKSTTTAVKNTAKQPPRPEPESESPDKITPAQTKKIYATAKDKQFSPEEAKAYIKKTFNKNSSKELTKAEASQMIEYLNEIKPEDSKLVRTAKELGAKEA